MPASCSIALSSMMPSSSRAISIELSLIALLFCLKGLDMEASATVLQPHGAGGEGVLTDATNEVWQNQWELHVMSHVYAARAVLPQMIDRGEGYLLNTASAAGLLAALGSGPYTVTKAAAVKLAEFIAINHGDEGIKVSVLCPQGVNTAMAPRSFGDGQTDGIIEPEQLAKTVVETIREERFYVLPHPEVEEYVRRKGNDVDRWLFGRRRLRRKSLED